MDDAHTVLAYLRQRLSYDREAGRFTWLVTAGRARVGQLAGYVGIQGHRYIGIGKGRVVVNARLVWLFERGEWPVGELVHRNRDTLDDRIENLILRSDKPELTQARLHELVHYDPDTGIFTRKTARRGMRPSRLPAGCVRPDGYVMLTVDGKYYRAHRLAWLYVYGRWPERHIDHINGNPTDNRIANIRGAAPFQNMANSRKPRTNTSGYKGVHWHKVARKWTARIRVRGVSVYLGLFATAEEAHAAYCARALAEKGEFARFE